MKSALEAVENGDSIRAAAKKFGVSESNIRRRKKLTSDGKELVGSGKNTILTKEQETELANCIGVLCNAGFSPCRNEIKDLVKEYVTIHKIENPFKENRPGKDWMRETLCQETTYQQKKQIC